METTVTIGLETWQRLKALKQSPKQTFDAIINALIDYMERVEEDKEGEE